jgi:hypothetical protein
MSQVPIFRTAIAMSDYARAVVAGWRAELGVTPSKAAAGVLWAQYMLETGGAACWCWNIGNVKVTQGQVDAGVSWFDLPGTWEIINGKREVLPEGHKGRRFRAYASLTAGMTEHLRFLRNNRYKVAWPSVEAGDCDGFARRLKAAGYYTASADDYARGMLAHWRKWMASDVFDKAVDSSPVDTEAPTLPALNDDNGEGTPTKTVPQMRPPPFEKVTILHPRVEFPPKVYDLEEDPDDVA